MKPVEKESPLSRAIATILYYFQADRKPGVPEGAVQKALTIVIKGLGQSIAPADLIHTKQGWIVKGLYNVASKYYETKPVRSGRAKHRYVFEPRIEVIEGDMRRRVFLETPLPRYVLPMAKLFHMKGGGDALVFVSLFMAGDAGFFEVGDGLYGAIEEITKLVLTRADFVSCCNEIDEYLNGVGHKIGLLENTGTYSIMLSELSGDGPDANLIISLANFIPSEDPELKMLLTICRRIKQEVAGIAEIAKEIRLRGLIDQRLLFKYAETDKEIFDRISEKAGSMLSLLCKNESPKLSSDQKFNFLCDWCKAWSFGFASGALVKETYHRETHWETHSNQDCDGDKIIAWADGIGSSKVEKQLGLRYPEQKEELELLWPQRSQAVIKNWGIVFGGRVTPVGAIMDGDQTVIIYDSLAQAILGSCFALFFARQINKVVDDSDLRLGYKIAIMNARVVRGVQLDTDSQRKIKIIKPEECRLLEHTQQDKPREGYIIIDKEYCEANKRALSAFDRFLYRTKVVDSQGNVLSEVYSIDAVGVVSEFAGKMVPFEAMER